MSRVALVTGAASSIGLAAAQHLASDGHAVALFAPPAKFLCIGGRMQRFQDVEIQRSDQRPPDDAGGSVASVIRIPDEAPVIRTERSK